MEPRHPVLIELYGYCLAKKQGRAVPARRDIDPAEIPKILPYIFLVDVEGNPPRFRYRLVGTEVGQRYGRDSTGLYLYQLDLDDQLEAVDGQYRAAVESKAPSWHALSYTKADGRHLEYERIILPLSADGATIDMLLCGIWFEHAYQTTASELPRRVRG